jgi:ribonuclease HI
MKTMKIRKLDDLKTIDPRPRAPWSVSPFEQVEILQDRDKALRRAEELARKPGTVFFTDASAKDSKVGGVVVIGGPALPQMETQKISIGPATRWNVH